MPCDTLSRNNFGPFLISFSINIQFRYFSLLDVSIYPHPPLPLPFCGICGTPARSIWLLLSSSSLQLPLPLQLQLRLPLLHSNRNFLLSKVTKCERRGSVADEVMSVIWQTRQSSALPGHGIYSIPESQSQSWSHLPSPSTLPAFSSLALRVAALTAGSAISVPPSES